MYGTIHLRQAHLHFFVLSAKSIIQQLNIFQFLPPDIFPENLWEQDNRFHSIYLSAMFNNTWQKTWIITKISANVNTDKTWLNEDTFSLLRKYNANFCIFDLEEIDCPIEVTGQIVYLRFHGPGKKYESRYSKKSLEPWAERIKDWLQNDLSIFAYFNNDFHGNAIDNARMLIELTS